MQDVERKEEHGVEKTGERRCMKRREGEGRPSIEKENQREEEEGGEEAEEEGDAGATMAGRKEF